MSLGDHAPISQPWKANWPPKAAAGHKYTVDAEGAAVIDGAHNCAGLGDFFDLSCAQKPAQPWKANWPPKAAAGHKYIVDAEGAAVIDGAHNCAGLGDFIDLSCA